MSFPFGVRPSGSYQQKTPAKTGRCLPPNKKVSNWSSSNPPKKVSFQMFLFQVSPTCTPGRKAKKNSVSRYQFHHRWKHRHLCLTQVLHFQQTNALCWRLQGLSSAEAGRLLKREGEPCPGDEPNLATSSFRFRIKWKYTLSLGVVLWLFSYYYQKRYSMTAIIIIIVIINIYACLLITRIVNRYYYCNWLDFLSSSYISRYHLMI